jgi:AP-3 complex subunit sigma
MRLVRDIFSLLSKRSDGVCNFVEGGGCVRRAAADGGRPTAGRRGGEGTGPVARRLGTWGKEVKLVYRHYATLYFVFAVDKQESELGILDLVQVFVEVLDKCFENVCELDLIFHPDRVHYILDEIVMGGMVLETSLPEILGAIAEMNKLEQSTKGLAAKA